MSADESINCRKASWLLSVAGERPLRDAEKKALKHHLSQCLHCRTFEQQLAFLQKASKLFGSR